VLSSKVRSDEGARWYFHVTRTIDILGRNCHPETLEDGAVGLKFIGLTASAAHDASDDDLNFQAQRAAA
jgi:hypothetical protein